MSKYGYMRGARGGKAGGRYRTRLNELTTPAEAAIESALVDLGIKYVQNKIVRTAEAPRGCYYIDFWLPAHKLGIELDGKPHVGLKAEWKDRLRTDSIQRAIPGSIIRRLWNREALADPHGCIKTILAEEADLAASA